MLDIELSVECCAVVVSICVEEREKQVVDYVGRGRVIFGRQFGEVVC